MRANRETLMRVPGIGLKGADAIIRARKSTRLVDLGQLRALGVAAPERLAPYVLLANGKPPHQLSLF